MWEYKCEVVNRNQMATIKGCIINLQGWHCCCWDGLVVTERKFEVAFIYKKAAERGRETDFVDKLVPASAAWIYDAGWGSLHATAQSKGLI
jgi:hypothetical protein